MSLYTQSMIETRDNICNHYGRWRINDNVDDVILYIMQPDSRKVLSKLN